MEIPSFVTDILLPYLLVFTIMFAVLDKTKVLGEGKRQINAIVAFVIALLLITLPYPRGLIIGLMPVLAVMTVVLLIFLMLYAFVYSGDKEWSMPAGLKIALVSLVGLALVIALLVLTGYWDVLITAITGGQGAEIASTIFFLAIIAAAIVIVLATGGKTTSSS